MWLMLVPRTLKGLRMARLLTMEDITKSFFGVKVLKDVDFDLDYGEVHVLLGENGAGKSTLMKILSGAYKTDAGSIILDGQKLDLSAYDPKSAELRYLQTSARVDRLTSVAFEK